jgi:hypothetical protein
MYINGTHESTVQCSSKYHAWQQIPKKATIKLKQTPVGYVENNDSFRNWYTSGGTVFYSALVRISA